MTMKEKIIDVLKGNKLTIKEITERINKEYQINTTEARIRSYIKRLKDDNAIEKCGIDNRYKVYKLKIVNSNNNFRNVLIELYEFMSNEEKCELKDINESDINFLTKIKEMMS